MQPNAQTSWALITGASSGLGTEFAHQLARRHFNLILTARTESPMHRLAAELTKQYPVRILVYPLDLATPGSAASLYNNLERQGIMPDILINNAGFGISGPFTDHTPRHLNAMLQLNMVSPSELALLFGREMTKRGHGHILFVASIAACQPTPLLAAYGATKAYLLSLGESLHVELKGMVKVTVLSPGLMETNFAETAHYLPPEAARSAILPVAKVAKIGLNAMFAGKSAVIAGRLNRVFAFCSRLTPRHWQASLIFRTAQR